MKKARRLAALLMCCAMVLGLSTAAFAGSGDILSIDGKNGKIFLNADEEGMDYPLKYLYDISFWYPQDSNTVEPTLGHVINFLSTGRQEGFGPRVDLNRFINSALGAKTAELWYIHMLYEDQMAPGLLRHWESIGLHKEAFLDNDPATGITEDYFVYTPTKVDAPAAGYPLLIVNHGGGEKAYQIETFGFCEIAAREGIVLAATENTGDEDNINAMIDKLIADYNVDESRIYVVGSSGGGSATLKFSIANIDRVAAAGIMDQPVSLATRWYAASDEQIAAMQKYNLPMVWVGGTADMYGLYGLYNISSNGREVNTEFFETSEGAEDQFISGWNAAMKAYGIQGKDITSRLDFIEDPANYAEENAGYPFDNVVDIDPTGTSPIYLCTMNGSDDIRLYLVENRAHMPSGYDAENIWSFISQYSRNPVTGVSEKN